MEEEREGEGRGRMFDDVALVGRALRVKLQVDEESAVARKTRAAFCW